MPWSASYRNLFRRRAPGASGVLALRVRVLLAAGYLAAAFLAPGTVPGLYAQIPRARLDQIFPTGGRHGTTLEVSASGADLDEASSLLFSHPGLRGTPIGGGRFRVEISPDVPPGRHDVRVAARFGISNPRAFVVGTLEEMLEKEPNDDILKPMLVKVGTIVNGRSDRGADRDYYRFSLEAGQKIIIDCDSHEIDSKLDPVLVLFDGEGRELFSERGRTPRIVYQAKVAGDLIVQIRDALYRSGGDYAYRLRLSSGPRIDFIFPPAGLPGTEAEFRIFGNHLPGGKSIEGEDLDGETLEELRVKIKIPDNQDGEFSTLHSLAPYSAEIDTFDYFLAGEGGASNPWPLGFASAPVVLEAEGNDRPEDAQRLTVPCELAGQFYPRGDVDWMMFDADKGEVFQIEVISHRLGLPTDPYLLLQQVTGSGDKQQVREIKRVDDLGGKVGAPYLDTGSDDAGFRFVAPAKASYRLMVKNLYADSKAEPRFVYRLSIRREAPDYRLLALPRYPELDPDPKKNKPTPSSLFLRRSDIARLDVYAFRRDGFAAAIDLSVEGLPSGVTCTPGAIPAGKDRATLFFAASDKAADWSGTVSILGAASPGTAAAKTGSGSASKVLRRARFATYLWAGGTSARLVSTLPLAVRSFEPASLSIRPESLVLKMSRGGKLDLPFQLIQRSPKKGKWTIDLGGLPAEVSAKRVTIEEKADRGKVTIEIKNKAAVGTFHVHLLARGQISYSRDADLALAARQRREELEKALPDLQAKAVASVESRKKAAAAANEAQSAFKKAEEAVTMASRLIVDLASAPPEEKGGEGKSIKEKIESRTADLIAAAEARVRTRDIAKLKSSESERVSQEATEAESKASESKKAFELAKKRADELGKQSKPKNLKHFVPSLPLRLEIVSAPFEVRSPPASLVLLPEKKSSLAIEVAKLFGFDGEVQIEIKPGGGLKLNGAKTKLAGGKANVTLQLEVVKGAKTGDYKSQIELSSNYGGGVSISYPITLHVEKTE